MRLEDARFLAEKVCAVLRPFCERVVVAGSVRRGRAEVNDVDIVAALMGLVDHQKIVST